MAQFGYKGAKLSSDEDVFTTGKKCFSYTQFSSQPPPPRPLPTRPLSLPSYVRSVILQYFQRYSSTMIINSTQARNIITGKRMHAFLSGDLD